MRRRRRRIGRREVRGRGIPYIFKNKVYLGKRPQKCSEALSRVLAKLLENVESVVEFNDKKKKKMQIKKKK